MHGVWSRGSRPRERPKTTWREVVKQDCQARTLNTEDAMNHSKWRKLIKDGRWSEWVWVGECFFWYRPTRVVPNQRPLNGCLCVCSYLYFCFWLYVLPIINDYDNVHCSLVITILVKALFRFKRWTPIFSNILTIVTSVKVGCVLYMWTDQPASFPEVTNETGVQRESHLSLGSHHEHYNEAAV